jgi:hypothetical protein
MTDPFKINENEFLSTSTEANRQLKKEEDTSILSDSKEFLNVPDDDFEDPEDKSYASLNLTLDDSLNPFKAIDGYDWLNSPETRKEQIDKSIATMRDGLMKEGAKVPTIINGNTEYVNASAAGRLTAAGEHAFDSAMQILSFAEQDEQGGYRVNPMSKKQTPLFGSSLMTPYDADQARSDRFKGIKDIEIGDTTYQVQSITPDQVTSDEHVRTIVDNIKIQTGKDVLKSEAFNVDGFLEWRNLIKNGGMTLSANNASAITQVMDTKDVEFDDKKKQQIASTLGRLKASANMPEDKLVDLYEGQPIFNYSKIKDLNEFENQLSKLNMPEAGKARLLATFRREFESSAGDLMQKAAEGGKVWDYMRNLLPSIAIPNMLGANIGFNSEDDYIQGLKEGRSFYDMVKSGTIDVDRNWLERAFEKTAISTISMFQGTGTGGAFLLSKGLGAYVGLVSEDAEKALDRAAGYVAEAGAVTQEAKRQYYENIGRIESIGNTGISSDDIYDLVGNIIETVSTGGITSLAKIGTKAVIKSASVKASKEIGKASAEKIATEFAKQGVKRSALSVQSRSLLEQTKAIWKNSALAAKAESVVATSLHGSFTSAGLSVSDGIRKGQDKAAAQGLTGDAALEFASNEATGYALVNGVATFVMMTAMNSIAPGIEKALISPESGISAIRAIRNSVANRANRKSISKLLQDVVGNQSTRKSIVEGVAQEVGGYMSKNGIGKFMGGVSAGAAAEFIEEAGDVALALAGEAYLLQDKDSRKLLEQTGYWSEVFKAGVLGALGGMGSGLIQTTSKDNKERLKYVSEAINTYKETLPQRIKDNMNEMVQIQGKRSSEIGRVDTLKNILNTGTVSEKVDALVNIGQNVVKEINPNATVTPITPASTTTTTTTPVSTTSTPTTQTGTNTTSAPAGTTTPTGTNPPTSNTAVTTIDPTDVDSIKTIVNGDLFKMYKDLPDTIVRVFNREGKQKVLERIDQLIKTVLEKIKNNDIGTIQGQLIVNQLINLKDSIPDVAPTKTSNQPTATQTSKTPKQPKQFKVEGSGMEITIDAPVDTDEELAAYAYKEAHGKNIPNGKLSIDKQTNIGITINNKPKVIPITTYSIDNKPADLHSFEYNGKTYFATRAKLASIVEGVIPNTKVTKSSLNKLSNVNEITSSEIKITPEPEQKPASEENQESAPKTQKETKPEETKPKEEETPAEPKKTIKQESEIVKEPTTRGLDVLSATFRRIANGFEKAFRSLGVNVIFYTDDTLANYPELKSTDTEPFAFYRNNLNVIGINISKIGSRKALFLKAIKHEFIHAIEGRFQKTEQGKKLAIEAAKEMADPELAEWMKKEYSSKWDSMNDLAKLSEVVRAFIGGNVNNDVFGRDSFKKYLKAFLKFAKKFTRSNTVFEQYRNALEADYKKIVKENAKAFDYKQSMTEAFVDFVEKIKNTSVSKTKRKSSQESNVIFSRDADDTDIQSAYNSAFLVLQDYLVDNETPSPDELLNVIQETIDGYMVGVNTSLSIPSKVKVYDMIVSELEKNSTDEATLDTIKEYRDSMTDDSIVMFNDIDEETEEGEAVIEAAKLKNWTNISRFIRASNVSDDVTVVSIKDQRPINDQQLFTNAYININEDENGNIQDLNLTYGDIVQVIDKGGKIESILFYSHTETTVDETTGRRSDSYRFMKGVAAINGKPTPFMRLRQAAYEREFYEEIQNSEFSMSFDSNVGAVIDSPKELVRTVFRSLLGGKETINQGDKEIGFDGIFTFISDPQVKSISPFFFTEGKVHVNLAKLENNFNFITRDMLKGDQSKTTALLVASSVRAAIEEELLHFATIGTFKPKELLNFADDLIKNETFNEIVRQIKLMQRITAENDSLSDEDKIIIATETLSFLHQKASEGAVYGDHYNELFERSLNGNSVVVARQFAQRMKYMLGARAVTSYMTPRMQEMVARLSLAKKELGLTRRQTNLYDLANKYSEEQYRNSRKRLDKIINDAFIKNATEIAELRELLNDIDIPAKNIINFNWKDKKIVLTDNFRQFYEDRKGEEALQSLEEYFSQLNENETLTEFTNSVRNSQERMMNYKDALDLSRDSDQAVVLAANGNVQALRDLIANKKDIEGWIDPNVLLSVLESINFDKPQDFVFKQETNLLRHFNAFKGFEVFGSEESNINALYLAMVDNGLIDPNSSIVVDVPKLREARAGVIRVRETMKKLMSVDVNNKNLNQAQLDSKLAEAELDYLDKIYRENLSEASRNSLKASVLKVLRDIQNAQEDVLDSDKMKAVENKIKELAFNQQSTKDGLAEIQQNENAKSEAIKLLREIKAPNTFVSSPYIQYAESVRTYNDMVTDYAEILLNRNINKVDDFGRQFNSLNSLLESPLSFEENMFGYENQTPVEAMIARKSKDNVASKMSDNPEAMRSQPEWQKGWRGRSVNSDRKDNPTKVTTIESNAAFLGETSYNELILAKLKGLLPKIGGVNITLDNYYNTMGFVVPYKENLKNADDVAHALLNDVLFKYKVPYDLEIVIDVDKNKNEIKSSLIQIKNRLKDITKTPAVSMGVARRISEALVGDGQLMDWFNSLETLIGFDRSAKIIDPEKALAVVQSINGKESFAYKFAKQMLFRMYNNEITANEGGRERTIGALNSTDKVSNYSLFDNIMDLQDLLMYSNQANYSENANFPSDMTDEKMIDIIRRLPEILESIDAINHDIGLARKSFSRFRSEHVRKTILGDIRLIQEQNADGIRANKELLDEIKNSFFDIQALDDIQWHLDYISKGGIVGVEGFSALQLMDRLAAIPSAASQEYFVTVPPSVRVGGLVDRYWALKEFFTNPMMKDADGKRLTGTDNYVYNTIEKVADRPDEFDENYMQDRAARPGMADETVNRMPEGSEQTQEQLEAARRKEQFEEFKKIKSWMTHAGIAIFQTFTDPKEVYSHEIDIYKVRQFFTLFAQAIAESEQAVDAMNAGQSDIQLSNEYRNRVNNMMAEQVQLWSNKYGADGFAEILANIAKYNHPIQFLEDVVNVIAIKERNYIANEQANSDTLGGIALTFLRRNVEASEKSAALIDRRIKRYNKISAEVDELRDKIAANEVIGTAESLRKANLYRNELYKKTALLERADFGESYNQRASRSILDSLQEDIDNGMLTPGTLFHARTYDFGSADSKVDNSLFMKSPLFSLLLQAMPNLIIYQPNESYTGKKNFVQNNMEFAALDNGDHILYVANSDGASSSKQSQILQQLIISLINKELGVVAGDVNKAQKTKSSILASRIQDIASNIRIQSQTAFEHTPERIASMVEKAAMGLIKTNIDPKHHKAILGKYKEGLESTAAEQLAILRYRDMRHQYTDSIFGRESPEAKAIMDDLIAPDVRTGTSSIITDIALVSDVLSNPDAYRLLNSIGGSGANLISFELSPLRKEAMNRAIKAFSSTEIRSQKMTEIELSRTGQTPTEFDPDNVNDFNESDIMDSIYGTTVADFQKAFEQTFFTGVTKEDTSARSFKKVNDAIQMASPRKIKSSIDAMLLIQNMNSNKATGQEYTYEQISQAKGAMQEFYETPDHTYRYIISELIGSLDSLTPQDADIETISIFDESYPVELLAPQSSYELLKARNNPTVFVRPIKADIMPEGNMLNYYYNKTPSTEIFERRRIQKFLNAMISATEHGSFLLERTFNSAKKEDAVTIDTIDATDNDVSIMRQLRKGVVELIGNDLMNEAQDNIKLIEQIRKNNMDSADNDILNIDSQIKEWQTKGREEILNFILNQNKNLHSKTAANLIATAESLTATILDLANKRESYSYRVNKAGATKAKKKYLSDYKRNLSEISKIDQAVVNLLADKEYLAKDPFRFNDGLKKLLDRRNTLARNSNSKLLIYGNQLALAIGNVVEKTDGLLEVSPELTSFIENKFNPLALSVIEYSEVNLDNISDFIAETKAYLNRGLINGRNKGLYQAVLTNVQSNKFIDELIKEYRENFDVQTAIENQIRDFENKVGDKSQDIDYLKKELVSINKEIARLKGNPKSKQKIDFLNKDKLAIVAQIRQLQKQAGGESVMAQAFKRLGVTKRNEIARSLAKAIDGQTNFGFIKNKVIEHLVRNESLLFELRDEVVFSDLASAFDSAAELDAETVMENQNMANIGIGLVAREIEKLIDVRNGIQRSLDSMRKSTQLNTRTLMTLQKEYRFSDKITEQRLLNNKAPTHQVVIDITLDEQLKKSNPLYAVQFDEALNTTRVINEAMRLFIEKEGQEMYRHINEHIDVFAGAFDIYQNIENVLEIARLRNALTEDMAILADDVFDNQINEADGKAVQLFGISVRDMDAMNYEPATVTKPADVQNGVDVENSSANKEAVNTVDIRRHARRESLRQRLRGLALFVNDTHSKSVFLPTNEIETKNETSYILYSRDAKTELAKLKRRENGSWSVDERLKNIIFNAATIPPLMPGQPLRTLDKKTVKIELDKEINDGLATAAGITTKVTVREFLQKVKANHLDYFLKQAINRDRSAFAKGLGIVSVMKEFNRLDDANVNELFDSVYAFASDVNNKPILQNSGMNFLSKKKDQYSPSEKRSIAQKAYEIVINENNFLNSKSAQSHAIMMNEAQIQDILMMLHSGELDSKKSKYGAVIGKAEKSMASLYNIIDSSQSPSFILAKAVYEADISHNYASLFSAIYGRNILEKLITGAFNATKTDNALYSMTYHQNALMRGKFRGNHGAYLEALSLVGMLDHGINGASGKNRYTSEYQDFQDRIGQASKNLNNNFMNGAKAYIIASLRGIAEAETRDALSGNRPGMKAWEWATSFINGVNDHKASIAGKSKLQKASSIGIKVVNKLYNKSYKQDKEAQAVIDIFEIIKRDATTLASAVRGPIANSKTPSGESYQQVLINNMIRDLQKGMSESEIAAVTEYSDALLKEFGSITDAHRIANVFSSKDMRTETGSKDKTLTGNDPFEKVYRTSYSTVPLRFSYLRNPLDTTSYDVNQETIDIDEFISFESSTLNFVNRKSKNKSEKDRNILRPIDLNPFTAPDSLANDALYRTYMAPTYNVIRKLMGRIVRKNNGDMITEGGMLKEIGVAENVYNSGQNYEYISAYIMNTIEKQIRNDMPQELMENAFNNAIKFSTLLVLAKQLISFWQPILNGFVPAASKGANILFGKMLGYSDKDISRYSEALWLALKNDPQMANFVKENSVTSYKHRAEGANIRSTQIKIARYHRENRIKYGLRYAMAKFNDLAEGSLDVLIGAPERVMVKAIYAFELHNRLKQDMENPPATIQEMFKMNPDEISTLSKTRADIMVTDFMGLGDKSKKAGIYNIDKRMPVRSLLLNGFVRHGNHSATVNANRAMYAEMFISKSFGKYDNLDKETINEGVENIAGTMIQNSMFFLFRAAAISQFGAYIASAMAEMFDDDDDEDIAERASRYVESLTQWNEESPWMWNILKEQLFPSYMLVNDPNFSKDGHNSAYLSLVKDVGQDVAWDAVGITPAGLGALFSFGPTQALVKSASKDTATIYTGNSEDDWYEMKDSVRDTERMNPLQSVLQEPYSTAINMAALLQNRFTPKDGFNGISNTEFIYGLVNQMGGTREGRGRTPKRHAEEGGWGYKELKDKGFIDYYGVPSPFREEGMDESY